MKRPILMIPWVWGSGGRFMVMDIDKELEKTSQRK